MSLVALLEPVLGPVRVTPAQRGQLVSFERLGRWHTLKVIEAPHVELSLPVPELATLSLRVQLGPRTVLGDAEHADDPRWRVRTRTPALARAVLAEPPWPRHAARRVGGPLGRQLADLATIVVGIFTYQAVTPDRLAVTEPVPHYWLDVEHGVATIQRPAGESDPARGLGMVRRLVQVATWPDRALGALRDLATALGGELHGERWAPGGAAVELRRGPVTIRIDHHLTRTALLTRIVARGVREETAYLDGIVPGAAAVARAVDDLAARGGPGRTGAGPYR